MSTVYRTGAASKIPSALVELWQEYAHSTAKEGEDFTEEVTYELCLKGWIELMGVVKMEGGGHWLISLGDSRKFRVTERSGVGWGGKRRKEKSLGQGERLIKQTLIISSGELREDQTQPPDSTRLTHPIPKPGILARKLRDWPQAICCYFLRCGWAESWTEGWTRGT